MTEYRDTIIVPLCEQTMKSSRFSVHCELNYCDVTLFFQPFHRGMRRIASKVHQQVSRLLNAGFMRTPVWYQAVLDHPPLPLPPRMILQRTSFDLPTPAKKIESSDSPLPSKKQRGSSKYFRAPQVLPKPIEYLEDCVRRQFFRDRPFEAFRAKTLVEDGTIEEEHIVAGKEWTRLRQRGRVLLPEE